MIPVPSKQREVLDLANELIETCRVSVGARAAYYRLMNAIAETGRYDGTKSLINLLYKHLDTTASYLFSPVELKLAVSFEKIYPKFILDRAEVVGKVLTTSWQRTGTDTTFGRGVFEALKYGAAVLKQWPQMEGEPGKEKPKYKKKLVMPWSFGVYREDENDINEQECLCETISLTIPEVWRRIWHLPNADKLLEKIKTHAKKGEASSDPASFFHQVLSTSQLNTGVQGMTRPIPGGIVQLNNDPNYSIMGPVIAADLVQMHELWVKDEHDYVTIQVIEPDILISPLFKKSNLLIKDSGIQPYTLIQPNEVTNWFWGRSELVDLIEPQALLSTWADDVKRLFGLQVDKVLAFIGETGLKDEMYAQFRAAGYTSLPPGSSVQDLTPKFPPEAMPMLKFLIDTINIIGRTPPVLQGQGEQGVRAGSHAETLVKTASPTLRDRALLVERQCATAADLTLAIKEAKDETFYWTKSDDPIKDVEETKFLLAELPDDWQVNVDSHTASPIFSNENQQLIFALRKTGDVDGEYVIDNMPIPHKDVAKARLREKEKKQAEMFKQHPELLEAALHKQVTGGHKH